MPEHRKRESLRRLNIHPPAARQLLLMLQYPSVQSTDQGRVRGFIQSRHGVTQHRQHKRNELPQLIGARKTSRGFHPTER